jgi:hypothetical protein
MQYLRARTKDGTYVHTGGSTYITYDNAVIDLNIVPQVPPDATLNDLKIDGTTVSGFASDKYNYDVILQSKGKKDTKSISSNIVRRQHYIHLAGNSFAFRSKSNNFATSFCNLL